MNLLDLIQSLLSQQTAAQQFGQQFQNVQQQGGLAPAQLQQAVQQQMFQQPPQAQQAQQTGLLNFLRMLGGP